MVAMLFCQLGGAASLREICQGLATSEGKLRRLGVPEAPRSFTLAYANEYRPWKLFEDVCYQVLDLCRTQARQSGSRSAAKHALEYMSAGHPHTYALNGRVPLTDARVSKRSQPASPGGITSSIRSAFYQPRRVRN